MDGDKTANLALRRRVQLLLVVQDLDDDDPFGFGSNEAQLLGFPACEAPEGESRGCNYTAVVDTTAIIEASATFFDAVTIVSPCSATSDTGVAQCAFVVPDVQSVALLVQWE